MKTNIETLSQSVTTKALMDIFATHVGGVTMIQHGRFLTRFMDEEILPWIQTGEFTYNDFGRYALEIWPDVIRAIENISLEEIEENKYKRDLYTHLNILKDMVLSTLTYEAMCEKMNLLKTKGLEEKNDPSWQLNRLTQAIRSELEKFIEETLVLIGVEYNGGNWVDEDTPMYSVMEDIQDALGDILIYLKYLSTEARGFNPKVRKTYRDLVNQDIDVFLKENPDKDLSAMTFSPSLEKHLKESFNPSRYPMLYRHLTTRFNQEDAVWSFSKSFLPFLTEVAM